MFDKPAAGWRPSASLNALESRAQQLHFVRDFFAARKVLEVETPVLAGHGVSDLNIDSVKACVAATPGHSDLEAWLQTSPEYHMKRLLAAGAGAIYQISRAFRDGERGSRHNPEFSLLEWYRPGFDDQQLMQEVGELVCDWLQLPNPQRLCYRDALIKFVGLDPFEATQQCLASRCEAWVGADLAHTLERDACLDILMSHEVEPALRSEPPTFITHYPASQAALAKTSRIEGLEVAHRFELYVEGVELCNGYWELTDATEQRRRFEQDNQRRADAGKPIMPPDERFLSAIDAGLPDCSGVALGLDRLLMLKLGTGSIDDVIAFPIERA
ncbi:EF-P lysine aminoacylase EpmA [Marinobacter caseinilyticus]|uniref:EF-P lysine aminoacylase EpmA n=1 Tax=Marinobacter caseinilyticus TaxID=2692195 RepID=UPI001409D521|nr:EF-P lysine aminoacylase EpmA [Marinobacter caseinilyticus]